MFCIPSQTTLNLLCELPSQLGKHVVQVVPTVRQNIFNEDQDYLHESPHFVPARRSIATRQKSKIG
jgi:hypothetical protein